MASALNSAIKGTDINTAYRNVTKYMGDFVRSTSDIKYLIIHHTATKNDQTNGLHRTFIGETGREVSVHYLILRNGEIRQYLNDTFVAWHVGSTDIHPEVSNSNSLGIEVENEGLGLPAYPMTPEQHTALIKLSIFLLKKYGIPLEKTFGHKEVTKRKIDPAFYPNMDSFRQELRNAWNTTETPQITKNYLGIASVDIFQESDADYQVPLLKTTMRDLKDLIQIAMIRLYYAGKVSIEGVGGSQKDFTLAQSNRFVELLHKYIPNPSTYLLTDGRFSNGGHQRVLKMFNGNPADASDSNYGVGDIKDLIELTFFRVLTYSQYVQGVPAYLATQIAYPEFSSARFRKFKRVKLFATSDNDYQNRAISLGDVKDLIEIAVYRFVVALLDNNIEIRGGTNKFVAFDLNETTNIC